MLEGLIEALLFLNPRGYKVKEIAKLLSKKESEVIKVLEELRKKYETFSSSLEISNENGIWKFRVKSEYIEKIKDKVKVRSEFSEGLLKTLAVIAYKKKIKQSEVIKIRGNKAYEHIKKLIDLGFIKARELGRSKMLYVTDKFYQYFDLVNEEVIEKKENGE